MNYLDVLKTIYTKQKLGEIDDIGFCISLTRTLAKDVDNLKALKQIVPYLFCVKPLHYFFLLYMFIPKKNFIPRLPKFEKVETKEHYVTTAISNIFGWSNKETAQYDDLIKSVILNDEKAWEEELSLNDKPIKEKVKNGRKSKLSL